MRLNIENMLLYARTISYLKKEQLFHIAWHGIRRRAGLSRRWEARLSSDDPSWRHLEPAAPFLASPGINAEDIKRGRFEFLNVFDDFGRKPDWTGGDGDRLWRYNLHYFAYLMANGGLPERAACHLIHDWIEKNPPGTPDAWDPFPTSLRLVNWIKYLSTAPSFSTRACHAARSIRVQAAWLEGCLEYRLLGNHLFKNAKALIFAGLFCRGQDGRRWLAKGLGILRKELKEQVLADGGHFERSPMYHSMILEDCLDLLNVLVGLRQDERFSSKTGCDLDVMKMKLQDITSRMAAFLAGIVHPDRQISLFNDAALGIEQTPDSLFAYYEKVTGRKVDNPEGELWAFPESGYFVMAPCPGDRLIADCGAIGPDYQLGHAHSDTLSFELSLKGMRVIVDSGCSRYEKGEIREYNRGNLGHNTVTIDGCNQSEVWDSHRCARRARPLYARLGKRDDGAMVFKGAHDGYARLPGSPIHYRSIRWTGDQIQIRDCITGRGTHGIESRLHVHPDLALHSKDETVLISSGNETLLEVTLSGGGAIELTRGCYCPEFGVERECTVLRAYESKAELPFSAGWVLRPGCSLNQQ